MSSVREVLSAVRVKVRSPDGSIEIRFTVIDGPRVRIDPVKMRQHTESSLTEQLQRALAGYLTGGRTACRTAVAKEFGEPETFAKDSPEARFAAERRRRARDLAADVVTERISAKRYLLMRLHAIDGFTIRLAAGSLRRFDAGSIADEMNALLQSVLTEHNAKLNEIIGTVAREFTSSKLEEMIHERQHS